MYFRYLFVSEDEFNTIGVLPSLVLADGYPVFWAVRIFAEDTPHVFTRGNEAEALHRLGRGF